MAESRDEFLARVAAEHDAWVARHMDDVPFDPNGRPGSGDYNLWHVDMDARAEAQAELMNAIGSTPEFRRDQSAGTRESLIEATAVPVPAETATWVADVTADAITEVEALGIRIGLENTDESTFRSYFMAAAQERLQQEARFQTEWHKFDLLVQAPEKVGDTLIEFKYYIYRRTTELDGTAGRWKGGAGPANEREFRTCLEKLRSPLVPPRIDHRRLVLVYERDAPAPFRNTFHRSFGSLERSPLIAASEPRSGNRLEARILTPAVSATG